MDIIHTIPILGVMDITLKGEILMWTIVVILLILWALGFFGPRVIPRIPRTGNFLHVLLVIVVILIILRLLGIT
jgi:hypothetical protein